MLFRNAASRPAYINTFTAEFINSKIRQLALQKTETFIIQKSNVKSTKWQKLSVGRYFLTIAAWKRVKCFGERFKRFLIVKAFLSFGNNSLDFQAET